MAVQWHIAFSADVIGVGAVAGGQCVRRDRHEGYRRRRHHLGPYWCAEDNVEIALNACMTTPELIVIDDLVAATRAAAEVDSIDK